MSGVKNLRAMFEQKGETSPPDRGRSPGIPWSSDSPRPLSKVKTSFIAIEKDGRIGLQRETSQDSVNSVLSATRKLSGGSSDGPTPPAIKQDSDVFGANTSSSTAAKMDLKQQPILESPRTEVGGAAATSAAKDASESKPQTPSTVVPRPKKLGSNGATNDEPSANDGAASNGKPSEKERNGPDNSKDKGKGKAPNKDVERAQAKTNAKPSPRPLANTSKPVPKPARSPTTTQGPKTPTDMTTAKLPAKTPDKVIKDKAATPRAGGASAKATGSSSIKRPPPLQASPASGTGFVKPKPKSPTRPVDLPARLTTHTAASGSKVNGGPRQSLSRASGHLNPADSSGRAPSRASTSTAASGAKLTVAKTLKRQNSTISRPRPSLGPPPKQPARDHPPTKKEKEVDEGFLKRMTRPTAAFVSKTAGKAPASPPRKVAPATSAKKPVAKSEPAAAKKTTLPHRPKGPAGPSQQPQTLTTPQIAIRVEQAETAEQVIEVAKAVEETPAPSEELKEDPAPAMEAETPAE
ncbi:hypothetical protein V8F20_008166, partial [Naviculisporaceae sp. PSN 640]